MNTFKKVALSLLVVGSAIGTQAFRASESKVKTLAPFIYVLNEDGTTYSFYSDNEIPDCFSGPSSPCYITVPERLPADEFPASTPPANATFSTTQGWVPN